MARELLIILALPLFAAGAFVAARRPEIPLLAALALIAFEGSIRAFAGLEIADPVSGLLACFVVGTVGRLVLSRRRSPIIMWPALLPLAGFIALTTAGILAASTIQLGIAAFRDAAIFMLAGLIMAIGLTERRAWRRLLNGVVLLSLLVGAYATFRWIAGPAAEELAQASGPRSNVRIGERVGLFGSFTTRGSLARWAVHTIPLCLALTLLGRGPWRAVAAAGGALCSVALVGTEVRVALVATVLAVVVVLVLQSSVRARPGLRLGTTFVAVAGSIAIGVAAFTVVSDSTPGSAERFARIFSPSEDQSFGVRQTRWPEALQIASDNPFGLGLGVAGRQARSQQYVTFGAANTDNSYIQVSIEQGIPALILLVVAILVLIGGLARHALRTSDPEHAAAGLAGSASLLALLVLMYTGLSLGGPPVMLVWTAVGLALSGRLMAAPRRVFVPLDRAIQPQPAV